MLRINHYRMKKIPTCKGCAKEHTGKGLDEIPLIWVTQGWLAKVIGMEVVGAYKSAHPGLQTNKC